VAEAGLKRKHLRHGMKWCAGVCHTRKHGGDTVRARTQCTGLTPEDLSCRGIEFVSKGHDSAFAFLIVTQTVVAPAQASDSRGILKKQNSQADS
jgi:hypothetical protein